MVIEVVNLRIRPEVDEARFVAAVGESMAFLERRPGFLGREIGATAHGEWIDIVRWADLESALAAAAAFTAAPEAEAFNACLERGSAQLRHFRSVYRSRGNRRVAIPDVD